VELPRLAGGVPAPSGAQDGVGQDHELASNGGQDYLDLLARAHQSLLERTQRRVVACRAQGCHVQHLPHRFATALDTAEAAVAAAVVVERCQPRQRRRPPLAESSPGGWRSRRSCLVPPDEGRHRRCNARTSLVWPCAKPGQRRPRLEQMNAPSSSRTESRTSLHRAASRSSTTSWWSASPTRPSSFSTARDEWPPGTSLPNASRQPPCASGRRNPPYRLQDARQRSSRHGSWPSGEHREKAR
jgi:hypothetical protein